MVIAPLTGSVLQTLTTFEILRTYQGKRKSVCFRKLSDKFFLLCTFFPQAMVKMQQMQCKIKLGTKRIQQFQ
jgi:hypothetical protein